MRKEWLRQEWCQILATVKKNILKLRRWSVQIIKLDTVKMTRIIEVQLQNGGKRIAVLKRRMIIIDLPFKIHWWQKYTILHSCSARIEQGRDHIFALINIISFIFHLLLLDSREAIHKTPRCKNNQISKTTKTVNSTANT